MRKVAITIAVLGIVAFVGTVLGTTSAFADEFGVGILLDPATSETTGSTFMEGFQLAVDQSPDVSHPPGVEGGDHLGSMDVVMHVVDNATGSDELLAAAIDLIEMESVDIIVADVSPDVLSALFGTVTESETMLIAMSGTGGTEFPETLFFFAAAEQEGAEALLNDKTPVFEDAFVAAYGRSPSAAATRGYIAGRLVDISVEATNRDPSDEQALNEGLLTAIGSSSVSSDINSRQTDATASTALAEQTDEPKPSLGVGGGLIAVIVVVIVTIAGLRFLRASPQWASLWKRSKWR